MGTSTPKYAPRLDALHHALASDFRKIVATIPLRKGQTVLDVGCGDGYFSSLLAEKAVRVIGLDSSEAYLREARQNVADSGAIEWKKGDARQLPFDDASLDVVWSAHSMHSYPDIQQCLSEFRRVLRPGGLLAVLESDNVHSVMLSWPPDLELAVRLAEHQEIGDEDSYIGTYFPRFAKRLMTESGFQDYAPEHFFIRRLGPSEPQLAEFVRLYLEDILERTNAHLSESNRSRLNLLANPSSAEFLPQQTTFSFGSLQVLMLARA